MNIRLAGIIFESLTNGKGLRKIFFSKGCKHNCKNCHNESMNSFDGGELLDIDFLVNSVLDTPYLKGVTFSGGDPFYQAKAFAEFSTKLKNHDINIWCYTGFTYEELIKLSEKDDSIYNLLHHIDVLVDGPYIEELNDGSTRYRGSKNQRIIDVVKSLKENKIIDISNQFDNR